MSSSTLARLKAERLERLNRMQIWNGKAPTVPINRVRPEQPRMAVPKLISPTSVRAGIAAEEKPAKDLSATPKRDYWSWKFAVPFREEPPVKVIQRAVADYYGITLDEMLSHRRTEAFLLPRQVAMYLAKKLTKKSLPSVGKVFDGRDHTTVLHAVRKINGLLEHDPELAAALDAIQASIIGRPITWCWWPGLEQ